MPASASTYPPTSAPTPSATHSRAEDAPDRPTLLRELGDLLRQVALFEEQRPALEEGIREVRAWMEEGRRKKWERGMGWTGRLCAEAVLLEQALQRMQPEVNIDDQLREKLFDDLHDLGTCAVPDWYQPHFLPELGVRASRWPEIMTKLQNPATILRLPSLPPSFFDALRDRDPAFDLAFRIAEDERVIRSAARRRRQYDPDYPLEIGECVELLVREFGVEEERAKSLLAVLPPKCFSEEED